MQTKTGLEIVRLHQDYLDKISELEQCTAKVAGYGYAQTVIEEQIDLLRAELTNLESTRFQILEPISITKSILGGS